MDTECSVVNCGNTPCETKVFYTFPTAFDTCMQWVQNTGDKKLMQDFSLGGSEVFMEKHICSDHFVEQDFAVFGERNSGLRCHVVPTVNVKKEPEKKDILKSSDKRKDVVIKSYTEVDSLPVFQKIKEEPNKIENNLASEEENNDRSVTDSVSILTFIKEEPDPDKIANMLPVPLGHSSDKNVVSATHDADFVTPQVQSPVLESSPLPTQFIPFNAADKDAESIDPLITAKIERVDIEEVLLPDTSTDNYTDIDESMDLIDQDQFADVPHYLEDIKDPNLLMDICGVSYIKTKKRNIKRKTNLSTKSKQARMATMARDRETLEAKSIRLEKVRIRAQERRESESELETTLRRYKSAVRAAVKRSRETEEEKALRREKNKIRAAQRRKRMTPEQRAEWRERNRIQTKERRERESELKKIVRRYNNAIRASIKRSSETPEQRMNRRLKDALRAAERRKSETPEEREERLKKDRERITLRRLQLLMSETPEQREARLKRERERMYRKRHGIKEDSESTETSNDATESQYSDETLQNLSEILSMYPPKVEIQVPEESESGLSESVATNSFL